MKKLILSLLMITSLTMFAQDTTSVKKEKTKTEHRKKGENKNGEHRKKGENRTGEHRHHKDKK